MTQGLSLETAYRVLGLLEGAEEALVRGAYRARAKSLHPDVGGSDGEFKRLDEALRVIEAAGFPPAPKGKGEGSGGPWEPAGYGAAGEAEPSDESMFPGPANAEEVADLARQARLAFRRRQPPG